RHLPCAPTVDLVATRPSLVRSRFSHGPLREGKLTGARVKYYAETRRRAAFLSVTLLLQIIQRAAAKRGEARAEDQPGVGEVRVRDDALGDDRARFAQIRRHELGAQIRRDVSGGAFLRLAVLPLIEAVSALPAEITRGHELGELLRHLGVPGGELLADGEADVQTHRVGELYRPHRHAERDRGRVERLGGDALVDQAQRLVDIGAEHPVDEEAWGILHRQRQLVDLADES